MTAAAVDPALPGQAEIRRRVTAAGAMPLGTVLAVALRPRHGILLALALLAAAGAAEAQSAAEEHESAIAVLLRYAPDLLAGFGMNLFIGIAATLLGSITGVVLGLGQLSLWPPLRRASWLIMQFFRNSPTMVLLFYISTVLEIEIAFAGEVYTLPGWAKAVLAISLSVMANTAEVVRGAVQSVPASQWDGAAALGYDRRQTLWQVILPQGLPLMVLPLLNYFIIITMATTLASVVGVSEVLSVARRALAIEEGRDELIAPMYLLVLIMFFVFSFLMTRWVIAFNNRLFRHAQVDH